jgi:glutathionyl-hydroquinone reductase
LITRKLKGLEDFIAVTSVHWQMGEKGMCRFSTFVYIYVLKKREIGWRFVTADDKLPGADVHPDPLHPGFTHLRDIYFDVDPEYTGRFTVPTLYDTKSKRIVSNEVSPIPSISYML